ncbi:MAG: helix-turn-helix transcriptional regulator [Proteobacteria bacterium]|nr:helix-turn-helix transcriptional regulator [Pseudomonadota bacterium]
MNSESNIAYFFDALVASFHQNLVRPAHRHGAAQLTVSLDGQPHGVGTEGASVRGSILFAAAHAEHAYDGGDGQQLLLWLAPDSRAARILARDHAGSSGCGALPESQLADLPLAALRRAHAERWSAAELRPLVDRVVDTLTGHQVTQPIHPAVRRAVRHLRALPIKKISADVLAAEVGLSKSRLLHLLKEHLGIPLRPYLAWLRCIDAIVLMSRGADATEAALCAGFTDGAHFNRVMKQLFALSPSAIAKRAQVEVAVGVA